MTILGDKDRRRINLQTAGLPWRAICSLEIESARGPYRGTGWLAGPTLVLTAGHCVFDPERFGGWARGITVTPGRTSASMPFGSLRADRFSAAEGWLSAQDKNFDLGCIRLSRDAGVGWLGFAVHDAPSVKGKQTSMSGYPEYAGLYTNQLVGQGAIRAVKGNRVFYQIDTTDGQSGSPVWIEDDAGQPVVIAVHTYERDSNPKSVRVAANSGTLITPNIASIIRSWNEADLLIA